MRENKHGAPPIAVIERGKGMDHACQIAVEYVFTSSSERKQRLLFWVLKQMNMLSKCGRGRCNYRIIMNFTAPSFAKESRLAHSPHYY
ncbi:hypothetical protein YC2023_059265 [Brassica napus]